MISAQSYTYYPSVSIIPASSPPGPSSSGTEEVCLPPGLKLKVSIKQTQRRMKTITGRRRQLCFVYWPHNAVEKTKNKNTNNPHTIADISCDGTIIHFCVLNRDIWEELFKISSFTSANVRRSLCLEIWWRMNTQLSILNPPGYSCPSTDGHNDTISAWISNWFFFFASLRQITFRNCHL